MGKLTYAMFTAMLVFPTQGAPCTVLAMPGSNIVAKSYDWDLSHGMFIVNKRDVSKTALDLVGDGNPARWTSRFGSLTMNQYGREFPVSGMNEAGLILEVAVGPAQYPDRDDRPSVNELQWVQYQLDNRRTVAEVLEHIEDIRIAPVSTALHYFIADRNGQSAVVEFLDGRVAIHSTLQGNFDIPVITNSSYSSSAQYARNFSGLGGNQPLPADTLSLSRFVRAAATADQGPSTVDTALKALRSVRFGNGFTKWNIVYDENIIWFASSTNDFQIKTIDIDRFDFSCASSIEAHDVNSTYFGAIEDRFSSYSWGQNRRMVRDAGLDPRIVDAIAEYPESLVCASRKRPSA